MPRRAVALRRRSVGPDALRAALAAGESVPLVLASNAELSPDAAAAVAAARTAGAVIREISPAQLARLCQRQKHGDGPELIGLVGADPRRDLDGMMRGARSVWQLVDTAYPGNAGFVIRTAELAGADGVAISAGFSHADRRGVRRAAMRADRFLPVHYAPAPRVIEAARRAQLRLVAIEDSGSVAPWEIDLLVPSLFIVGSEQDGIPQSLLDESDLVLRIPTLGAMPSLNMHAAMAAVAFERVRQLDVAGAD